MDQLKIKAPAKINLFLKILGKRKGGYHNILSWFQAVSLYDYLTFRKSSDGLSSLKITGAPNLPNDDRNLIIKTTQLMFEKYSLAAGLDIILEKKIPISAGLGGGSADAAATIYATNKMFGLNLANSEMAQIGLEIGSDVPFFFSSGQAEVKGRGDKIRDIELPRNYSILLITPELAISTAESYAHLKMDLTIPEPDIKLFSCKDFNGLVSILKDIENDFEKVHMKLYPVLNEIMAVLLDSGAILCRLSGTGPTMFGLFENISEREDLQQLRRENWRVSIVKPVALPAWEHIDD
jgi:4-diphosphocytidyl-2-C-methyl-D-erythritol kinase